MTGAPPPVLQRRILALDRSCSRRTRLDKALRLTLATLRDELASLEAARDHTASQVDQERAVLLHYQSRTDSMTMGPAPFTLDQLTHCYRYIRLVQARLDRLEAELDEACTAVEEHQATIAHTQRNIARNQSRIDLCREQIRDIRRVLERVASEASDDEAEEVTSARRFWLRRVSG